MSMKLGPFSPEEIQSMCDWVSECVWADLEDEDDIDYIPDELIIRGVNRYYCGGLVQFIKDRER